MESALVDFNSHHLLVTQGTRYFAAVLPKERKIVENVLAIWWSDTSIDWGKYWNCYDIGIERFKLEFGTFEFEHACRGNDMHRKAVKLFISETSRKRQNISAQGVCKNGTVDVVKVCHKWIEELNGSTVQLIDACSVKGHALDQQSFKHLVFRVYQLICLAAKCSGVTDEQVEQLFHQHKSLTNKLKWPNVLNISDAMNTAAASCNSFDDLFWQVPTKEMIDTFRVGGGQSASKIPSALITIVNEYCKLDPMSVEDDELITQNLLK